MILSGFTQKQKSAVVWYSNKYELVIMKAWPPVAHFRTAEAFLDVAYNIDKIMEEYLAYCKEERRKNKIKRQKAYAERTAAK